MIRLEYVKTIIHGDEDMRREQLEGVLRNYLWGIRYFTGPVDLFRQHNRDIYYVLGGPEELRTAWTEPHLRPDERENLRKVEIADVLNRLVTIPKWWPGMN